MALSLSSISVVVPPSKPSSCSFRSRGLDLSRRAHLRSAAFPVDPSIALRHCRRRKARRRGGGDGFTSFVRASADYYSTLGVPKSASGKEIKAAYRRLARQVFGPQRDAMGLF
ncbi:hypothetical protein BHE74_00059448 [Ensete ventricosum]|nr:hypothetical protein BHE74_00059448 [Ensete ventricosum]